MPNTLGPLDSGNLIDRASYEQFREIVTDAFGAEREGFFASLFQHLTGVEPPTGEDPIIVPEGLYHLHLEPSNPDSLSAKLARGKALSDLLAGRKPDRAYGAEILVRDAGEEFDSSTATAIQSRVEAFSTPLTVERKKEDSGGEIKPIDQGGGR